MTRVHGTASGRGAAGDRAPSVSVAMPVYNCEPFVAAAVDSVLGQTWTDFELIVVDDGSTDRTLAVLEDMAGRDPRIRLVSRPNTGFGRALVECVSLARGTYLARIDGDDVATPERFTRQVQALDADPDLAVVGSNAQAIDERGRLIGDYFVPREHEQIDAMHVAGRSAIHHPAAMIRMSMFRQVGGYRVDRVPCEDLDLWLRLAEVGRLTNLEQVLCLKRMLTSGMVVSRQAERRRILREIMDETYRRRGLPGRAPLRQTGPSCPGEFYRQWGWMAWRAGSRPVAREMAWRAVRSGPFQVEPWRLLLCTWLRRCTMDEKWRGVDAASPAESR